MATKKKQKQYGPLGHEKACDYIMVVNSCMGSEPSLMIIQFYAGKPFTADYFFRDLTSEEILEQGRIWREYYAERDINSRKTSKHLAKMFWKDAKVNGSVLQKAAPDGKILKYYPMSEKMPDGLDALADRFSFDALVEIQPRHQD